MPQPHINFRREKRLLYAHVKVYRKQLTKVLQVWLTKAPQVSQLKIICMKCFTVIGLNAHVKQAKENKMRLFTLKNHAVNESWKLIHALFWFAVSIIALLILGYTC